MMHCYHPNNALYGPPIGATKAGVAKPLPADLVLSTDNPAVAFANHGTWTRISRGATAIPPGQTLVVTVKARSESLNIEDTAIVTFHGPPPDDPDALDIDEPNYTEAVD